MGFSRQGSTTAAALNLDDLIKSLVRAPAWQTRLLTWGSRGYRFGVFEGGQVKIFYDFCICLGCWAPEAACMRIVMICNYVGFVYHGSLRGGRFYHTRVDADFFFALPCAICGCIMLQHLHCIHFAKISTLPPLYKKHHRIACIRIVACQS